MPKDDANEFFTAVSCSRMRICSTSSGETSALVTQASELLIADCARADEGFRGPAKNHSGRDVSFFCRAAHLPIAVCTLALMRFPTAPAALKL